MDDETAHLMSYLPSPTDPRDAEIARLRKALTSAVGDLESIAETEGWSLDLSEYRAALAD